MLTAFVCSIVFNLSSRADIPSSFSTGSPSVGSASPEISPSTKIIPTWPALKSLEYCFIVTTDASSSGAIPSRSIFSSTFPWPQNPETNIITIKIAITPFDHLIGTWTTFSNTGRGGCFGLRKSNNRVKLGTIVIVRK